MNTRKIRILIALFLLIEILLIFLAPEDVELGSMLKLIYLHGALTNTGLFLFTTAGLMGLASLFRNIPVTFMLAFEKTAIIFWVTATLLGNIASQLVWGGIVLSEPRFQYSILISILSVCIYFISRAVDSYRVIALLAMGQATAVWMLVLRIGRILHPVNPFGASESTIQLFYMAITLVLIATSVSVAIWIKEKANP